jgi:hypothetical protein
MSKKSCRTPQEGTRISHSCTVWRAVSVTARMRRPRGNHEGIYGCSATASRPSIRIHSVGRLGSAGAGRGSRSNLRAPTKDVDPSPTFSLVGLPSTLATLLPQRDLGFNACCRNFLTSRLKRRPRPCSSCPGPASKTVLLFDFVLEREGHAGAEGGNLPVVYFHIHLSDLGHA